MGVAKLETYKTLREPFDMPAYTRLDVGPDEAHVLVDGPLSWTWAVAFEPRPELGVTWETGWHIAVLGLVRAEAEGAMEAAMLKLQDDVYRWNFRRGAHDQYPPMYPLASAPEAELRAFRTRMLEQLERS